MTTGLIVDNLAAAKTMLANCVSWQALKPGWVDAATAAAGVHLIGLTPGEDGVTAARPFATVAPQPASLTLQLAGAGATMSHTARGVTLITLEISADIQEGDDPTRDPALRFVGTLGNIITELAALSNTLVDGAGMIRLNRLSVTEGPIRTAEDDVETDGDAFMATIALDWGQR